MRQAFLPGSRLGLQTVRRDGALTAVLPLVLTRGAARSPTNWHTPELAMVAEDPESARLLLEAALALPVHRVDLRFLQAEHRQLVLAVARDAGHPTTCRRLQTSLAISVDAPWDDVHASLSANQRKDLRRSTRRLAGRGRVSWHLHDGRDGLDDLLAEGFRIEASGWKGQAGTAITSSPTTTCFYTQVARWAAPLDLLRINVLRLDGRPVAFDLGLQQAGVLYSLKTGYDPALRDCSPGTVNFLRLVEHLCPDPQVRRIEMLGHETPWKSRLATTSREQFHVTAFVHPRRRRLHHAIARLTTAAQRQIVELVPDSTLDRLLRVRESLVTRRAV